MNPLIEEAKRDSARFILAECRARISHAIRQEMSRDVPNEERILELRLVQRQLSAERNAVLGGDWQTITRVRVLYGLLIKQVQL